MIRIKGEDHDPVQVYTDSAILDVTLHLQTSIKSTAVHTAKKLSTRTWHLQAVRLCWNGMK